LFLFSQYTTSRPARKDFYQRIWFHFPFFLVKTNKDFDSFLKIYSAFSLALLYNDYI